jgi:hypothetical protein
MPMLDAYIPEGALSPSAESELLATITDLLLEHEGVDSSNERARPLAWVFVHRPQVYVAGAPPKAPRYRFICTLKPSITTSVVPRWPRRRHRPWPRQRVAPGRSPSCALCVFTCEVPEGWSGGAGKDPQARGHLRARLARDGRAGARCAPTTGGRNLLAAAGD